MEWKGLDWIGFDSIELVWMVGLDGLDEVKEVAAAQADDQVAEGGRG